MSTATAPRNGRGVSVPVEPVGTSVVIDCKLDQVYYGSFLAVRDSHVQIPKGKITGFIGPSGCGKSTVLRSLNRMNDLIRGFRLHGQVRFHGTDVYGNGAFGLRLNRFRGDVAARVEQALRKAALLDEVKDKLKASGLSLSGGQQQRLCIARAVATEPSVLLMDEPCSALDPIATRRIEELMVQLKTHYTIAIVTHNMQQAQRVADETAFLSVDITKGTRTGYLVESGPTQQVFESPAELLTKEYVSGHFS